MNHKIRLLAAIPVLAIAACGPTSTHHHVNVHATPTSSTVVQGEADAKALIAKCIGGTPSTAELFAVFSSHARFDAAAQCLHITDKRAFELAVRDSFSAWFLAGGFKDKAGREAWLTSPNMLVTPSGKQVPSFALVLGMYAK